MKRHLITSLVLMLLLAVTGGALAQYLLGPGDVVRITVVGHPELETVARVSERGNVSFPYIGDVQVGGRSEVEAQNLIASRLREEEIVRVPQVTLLVEEYQSQVISVLGQVHRPGVYPIAVGQSLIDMIAKAGGIKEGGSWEILVTRQQDGGETLKRSINLEQALQGGVGSQELVARSGDIVFIPEAAVFYIYGEVSRPGAYQLRPNMTVMQAISVGGGITDHGTERGLEIRRESPDGDVEDVSASLGDRLLPNDVVLVKESLF